MASASPNELVEGTDYELIDKVHEDYYCPICFQLLNNARQMKCGHVLCASCLKRHADCLRERNQKCFCPVDRNIINLKSVMPVLFIDRMIASFQVKCLRNCHWTGQLSNLKEHRGKCPTKKCPFDGCNKLLLPGTKMKDHENSCPYRPVKCPYSVHGCKVQLRYCELENHMHNCMKMHLEIMEQAFEELQLCSAEDRNQYVHLQMIHEMLLHDYNQLNKSTNEKEKKLITVTTKMFFMMKICLGQKTTMLEYSKVLSFLKDKNWDKSCEIEALSAALLDRNKEIDDLAKKCFCLETSNNSLHGSLALLSEEMEIANTHCDYLKKELLKEKNSKECYIEDLAALNEAHYWEKEKYREVIDDLQKENKAIEKQIKDLQKSFNKELRRYNDSRKDALDITAKHIASLKKYRKKEVIMQWVIFLLFGFVAIIIYTFCFFLFPS